MDQHSQNPSEHQHRWIRNGGISSNTKVTIGLMATVIGAAVFITQAIYSAKTDWGTRMDSIEAREKAIETKMSTTKETWTDGDMFRWAVHLQRENPNLKVPEPENHSGR